MLKENYRIDKFETMEKNAVKLEKLNDIAIKQNHYERDLGSTQPSVDKNISEFHKNWFNSKSRST